jgi:hypothetical protein
MCSSEPHLLQTSPLWWQQQRIGPRSGTLLSHLSCQVQWSVTAMKGLLAQKKLIFFVASALCDALLHGTAGTEQTVPRWPSPALCFEALSNRSKSNIDDKDTVVHGQHGAQGRAWLRQPGDGASNTRVPTTCIADIYPQPQTSVW